MGAIKCLAFLDLWQRVGPPETFIETQMPIENTHMYIYIYIYILAQVWVPCQQFIYENYHIICWIFDIFESHPVVPVCFHHHWMAKIMFTSLLVWRAGGLAGWLFPGTVWHGRGNILKHFGVNCFTPDQTVSHCSVDFCALGVLLVNFANPRFR